MIISRTPLRISFMGGGSDFAEFYQQEQGLVVSAAINKYIYATVNKKFDDHIRVSYAKTEIVEKVGEIQHDLVREAMKLSGVDRGIEITTIADIPSSGTGLGSSSSFTVGILNALYAFKGENKSAEALARQACQVEIDIVKEPIGKQDQYIAAYGGFNAISFNPEGSVFVNPVIMNKKLKQELEASLMLFYTGFSRKASTILAQQKENTKKEKFSYLKRIKDLALLLRKNLESGSLDDFGRLLDESWQYKKELADGITNPQIDDLYNKARQNGALGGKLCGAGGGGFLLFYVPPENQPAVRQALSSLKETPFAFEMQGSKIIYICD